MLGPPQRPDVHKVELGYIGAAADEAAFGLYGHHSLMLYFGARDRVVPMAKGLLVEGLVNTADDFAPTKATLLD